MRPDWMTGTLSTVRASTACSRNCDSTAPGPAVCSVQRSSEQDARPLELRPEEFRVGRQDAGEPEMIAGGGRYQHLPPLAGDLVGQHFGPHLLADGMRIQEDQTGRGIAVG